ncbi:MAG TPA: 50S ribosomal protein L9 [Clostridiaceae bacterium]|nr:50S ribosomal protein L9 [Clostridiaceae bacterium]
MKVILKQDLKNLGEKNSVVEVKDGYARNYLLPKGLAIEANEVNLNIVKNKKEAEKVKKDKELDNAKDLAAKLNETVVTIKTKAGESGKLFGSITSMDIADNIKQNVGIDIDKKKINMPEAIKNLGEYEVEVRLYTGVNALVKVNIVGE